MTEFSASLRGHLSSKGEFAVEKIKDLHIHTDIKTKKGRQELIGLLFRLYGELRTYQLVGLLKNAGIHIRTRVTIGSDLKFLMKQGEIEKVYNGLYRSRHPSLFQPHERDEFDKLVKSCSYFAQEKTSGHASVTVYKLSEELRPQGLHQRFLDIAEKALARCIQNTLFSSYIHIAGQKHVPIAPSQLSGRIEIPPELLEEIWTEKAFKGKFVLAFMVDFPELHKWLKTKEGRHWLSGALMQTPKEFLDTANGILKGLKFIDKNGPLSMDLLESGLEKAGASASLAWILSYVESEEIQGQIQYRLNAKSYNIVQGLQRIESGEDPARIHELMKD